MAIECVIVDDSINDIQQISAIINNYIYGTNISFTISMLSNHSELNLLHEYDLYILDIDLPEINGFNLAKIIYEKHKYATIIFCTKHDDLVFDSFKLNAFYFVRKSFLESDLTLALQKFIKQYNNNLAYYILKGRNEICKIFYDDILYFEVFSNDLFIHTSDNKEYSERNSMANIIKIINKSDFVRIDKNYLINLKYVSSIEDNTLYLTSNKEFIIPRANIGRVKEEYVKYLMR